MGGYAIDQWVATPKGLVQAGSLGAPIPLCEVVELRLSDGSRVSCAADQQLLTKGRAWVAAADLDVADRLVRSFQYVPRSQCSTELPSAARAAAGRSSLDLPSIWDEDLAHYLGWLVGDGNFSVQGAVTIYGSEADRRETLPRHQRLLTKWAGFTPKPCVQANGTYQLRLKRREFVEYLLALGVAQVKSAEKVVPDAVLTAPEEALVAFLRGLFDADGCVVNDRRKGNRYAGLGSKSEQLLLCVQALLASLGISSRIYRTARKRDAFRYIRKDGTEVFYSSSGPSFDLRMTGRSLREFAALIDFDLEHKRLKLLYLIDDHSYYERDESASIAAIRRRPAIENVALKSDGQYLPPLVGLPAQYSVGDGRTTSGDT